MRTFITFMGETQVIFVEVCVSVPKDFYHTQVSL